MAGGDVTGRPPPRGPGGEVLSWTHMADAEARGGRCGLLQRGRYLAATLAPAVSKWKVRDVTPSAVADGVRRANVNGLRGF
jgi:hypothetical protein